MSSTNAVFISGSRSIKKLPEKVKEAVDNIISNNMYIFIGDASGVDTLVQQYLAEKQYTDRVYVFHIYKTPRNCVSNNFIACRVDTEKFENISNRKRQEYKDYYMTEKCDYFLVIWDKKSRGSMENIKRALKFGKTGKVFSFPDNSFLSKEEIANIIK